MDDEYQAYMLNSALGDPTGGYGGMPSDPVDFNDPLVGMPNTGGSAETGVGLPGEEAAETEKSVRADQDVYGPAAGGTGTTGTGGVTTTATPNTNPLAGIWNTLKPLIVGDDGKVNPMGAFGIAALMSTLGLGRSSPAPVGYQGGIPRYTAVRERVGGLDDITRRPGSGGRRYFTDIAYADPTKAAELKAAQTAAQTQATNLAAANKANPFYEKRLVEEKKEENKKNIVDAARPASKVIEDLPVPKYDEKGNVIAAYGGLMNLARGRYLNGSTDGMADKIPANIEGKQEARLSHGEFVIPADVVSHLGNGNSEAGAQELYSMMDRIRKARTGNPKQGKQIAPSKYLPS